MSAPKVTGHGTYVTFTTVNNCRWSGMMQTWHIFPIVLGIALIFWCLRPGTVFYPGGMGVASKDRPAPKWFGRLWFVLIGLWLITLGVTNSERLNRILSAAFAIAIGTLFVCVGALSGRIATPGVNGRGQAWRNRVIVLIAGAIFLLVGLNELRR